MAYSKVPFTYTGGPQVFATNFALGILEVEHIKVYVDGVVDGLGEPVEYAFTYDEATGDVTVTDALTVGQTGSINRIVPIDALIADFEAGADVSKRNLVRAVKQTLMAVQEAADGREADSILINETVDDINAIADGIADNVAQTTADRIAAEAAAAAAVPAAATATAQATIATTQAGIATTQNTAAQAAKTAAETAATNADADAAQTALDRIAVAADRATTVAAKDTAVAAQVTASSAATTATTQAGIATTKAAEAVDAASDVQGNIIPVGAIAYFAGTTAPSGWLAADGSQVTTLYPELRNYLIAAGNPFGATGGNPLLPNLVNTGFERGGNVPDAVLQDLKASGTAAATLTGNVWNVRELTTEDDPDGLLTYTPGQPTFTPTVDLFVNATIVSASTAVDRLWNVTDGVVVAPATTHAQSLSGNSGAIAHHLQAHLVAGKTYRFESRPTLTIAGPQPSSQGQELYLTANFFRKTPDVIRTPCVKAFGEINLVGMADLAQLLTSIATQAEAEAGTNNTKLMTPLRDRQAIDARMNISGLAPAYAVRAWGNYNMITPAIRDSRNIASVTRTAPGVVTVVLTTPMPDANYSVWAIAGDPTGNRLAAQANIVSASEFRIYVNNHGNAALQNAEFLTFGVVR